MVNNTHNSTFFGVRLDLLVCLFLALTILSVYWQVINHEFIDLDDDIYVFNNRHVQSGLVLENISWAFGISNKDIAYWHPLTWISHMLDCHIYGLRPGMHHLTSLIFHIANSVLLFLAFRTMTGDVWKSAFIAALFALHPINVDSVAWLAERKNVLSTFFWMLTILAYAHYSERPGLCRYLLTFLFFAFGLLAKPMIVTLPFALLLLDYWPLGRLRHPIIPSAFRLGMEKVPFLFISAISIYLSTSSLVSVEGHGNMISLEQVPLELRISNALVSYVSYIGKMVWPHDLAVHYPYPGTISLWKTVSSFIFLIFTSLLVVLSIKREPYLSTGWFWYIGTLIPVIGLVQAGLWPAMADRWAYVPLIGMFIVIAWGIPELLARWRYKKTILALLGVTVLSILTARTFFQIQYWKNSITLFEHSLYVSNNSFVLQNNLGNALLNLGKTADAIKHLSEALRINPRFAEAHNNLGRALDMQGATAEAISHYHEALRLKPRLPTAHNNLGVALAKQGAIAESISRYREALQLNPDYAEACYNLGNAMLAQGKITEAIGHYSEALRIKPNYAEAHNNLGVALARQGKMTEAVEHLSEALRINPGYADAQKNLKSALSSQGKTNDVSD
jgi:protein O-mannosyl-transferase